MTKVIYKGDILFVEGKDEFNFLTHSDFANGINVIPMGGYSELSNVLGIAQNHVKLGDISSIRIIVDADENIEGRKIELITTLKTMGLELPEGYVFGTVITLNDIKFGLFIMPNNGDNGSLEALLLKVLKFDSLLACVNNTIDCRHRADKPFQSSHTINQRDKVKLNLYISLLSIDYGFDDKNTIADTIKYDSPLFNPLKEFLRL